MVYHSRTHPKSGFTLIEVMAAVLIIAIVLIALLIEKGRSFKNTLVTHNHRIALMLATSKMEELKSGIETQSTGEFEEHSGFSWKLEQESFIVEVEEGVQLEMVKQTLEIEYPGMREEKEKIVLVNITSPKE